MTKTGFETIYNFGFDGMSDIELIRMALSALSVSTSPIPVDRNLIREAVSALKNRIKNDDEATKPREPIGWLYPEGLGAISRGDAWTLYGKKQDERCCIAVYDHQQRS